MEKKQSMMKQTAAKIKTKLNNTSSFFKLSLKTNNKALALALAAQKQRSRQLETETMCLHKDVQGLRFELAIQRHNNKQMFTILREFYNSSIDCMAKALNLISIEEASETMNAETNEDACRSENDVNKSLPEPSNKTSPSKCVEQEHLLVSPNVNVSALNDQLPHRSAVKSSLVQRKLPSPEKGHSTAHNTLYDSEMEMTVVDDISEIVTVQTKPKKTCNDQQRDRKTRARTNESIMSSNGEEPEMHLKDASVLASVGAQPEAVQMNMNRRTFACRNEEECSLQQVETELATARRKTYVASRRSKAKKQACSSQKRTEEYTDTRKTYVVSSSASDCVSCISSSDELDDYFTDVDVRQERKGSVGVSDVHLSHDKRTEGKDEEHVKEPHNDGAKNRKTVISQKSKLPKKIRKTKVPSVSTDQNESHKEGTKLINSNPSAAADNGAQILLDRAGNCESKTTWTEEPSPVKCRRTYVVHASLTSANNGILNDGHSGGVQVDVSHGQKASSRASEDETDSQFISSVPIEKSQKVASGPTNGSLDSDGDIFGNSLEPSPIQQSKPKSPRIELKTKVKIKNVTARARNKILGKKRDHSSLCNQNLDIFATELPGPSGTYNVKENCTSGTALQQSTEELQSTTLQRCFSHVPGKKTRNTNGINANEADGSDVSEMHDLNHGMMKDARSKPPAGQNSNCRKTMALNTSCQNSLFPNEESEGSLSAPSERLITPHFNDMHSTPRKTEQLLQKEHDLFSEERPPWEFLDVGFADSFTCESPDAAQQLLSDMSSRTVEMYEERNVTHQSIDERVMKSLTNTDLKENASLRTRRKAAPVSYKEPSLNCKMRRGDKYSDTSFLSSPLFKDKKKKRIKNNKE